MKKLSKGKKFLLSAGVAALLTLNVSQASAAFSVWGNFSIPSGQSVVTHRTNGTTLTRTTGSLPAGTMSRNARVESRNQSMWSNPQARINRTSAGGTWTSNFSGGISNNGHTYIAIPAADNITYRLEVRSASNQVGTDTAEFRFSVNNAVR